MKYRSILIMLLLSIFLTLAGCSKKEPQPIRPAKPVETNEDKVTAAAMQETAVPESVVPAAPSIQEAAVPETVSITAAIQEAAVTETTINEIASREAARVEQAQKYYQAGRQLALQGRVEEAETQFKKAIELDPKNFQVYDKLGMMYYSMARNDEAAGILKQAISLNPAIIEFTSSPGDVDIAAQNCAMLFDLGYRREAFEYLLKLSGRYPESQPVKTVELFCKLAEEEKPDGEILFRDLAAADIDACEKNLLMAEGYVFLGNAESALAYFDKVGQSCLQQPDALTQAAYYFAMARKPDKAIEICTKGLGQNPTHYPLRYVLTSVYSALEMLDDAVEAANDGVLASPHDVRFYYLLADRYMKAGQWSAAVGVYNAMLSSVEKAPDYFTAVQSADEGSLEEMDLENTDITGRFQPELIYSEMAMCYYYTNDFEKAIETANQALAIDKEFSPAYLGLCRGYTGLKQYNEALKVIDQAIELEPTLIEMYMEKAAVYHQTEEYEKAITPLEKAIELNPNDSLACQGLAQTYAKLQQYEKSLPYFERAAKNNPNMSNVGNVVACYVKLGQKEAALSVFLTYTKQDVSAFVTICCKDGSRALSEQRYDDAARSYETAIFADKACTEALYGLGCVFVETGQFRKASDQATALESLDSVLYNQLVRKINAGRN